MAAATDTKPAVNPLEDLGSLFSYMAENTEYYQPTGSTTTVVRGIKTSIPATIDGDPFDATILVNSGRLTRLTHMIQTRTNEAGQEEPYNLVSGIVSNVTQDIWLKVEGEDVPLWKYFHRIANTQAKSVGGTEIDEETFLKVARNVGFDWAHQGNGRPMFFHHMGASQAGIEEAFELFLTCGGKDVTDTIRPENRNRIQRAVSHPGLEVMRFEIGRANRERSQTGQGYIDPVDAEYSNYIRSVKLRTQATILRKTMQARKIEKDVTFTPEVEKEITEELNKLIQQAASWSTNLGGAQQQKQVGADGEIVTMDRWFAQHVPCGRLLVQKPEFEPAMTTATDEKPAEPILQADGTPVMKAKLVPAMDENGQPIMVDETTPKMVQEITEVELDFWRRDDDDVPKNIPGLTSEIDTTTAATGQTISVTSGAAPAGTGSATGDEEPF